MIQTCTIIILTTFIAVTFVSGATAQDTQYWFYQYGTRAELLGGMATGSLLGLSNTYYNPGALALIKDPRIVTSTFAIDYNSVNVKNGAGSGVDLASSGFRSAPSFIAGLLTIGLLKNHRIAYSFLTRQSFDFRLDGIRIDTRPIGWGINDEAFFSGEVYKEQRGSDIWGGLTWSRLLSSKSSIGISQYIAVRSQNTRFQAMAQAVTETGDGASTSVINQYDFTAVRTLWKMGLAFDYTPLTFGLAVTTPSLSLFGSGSAYVNGTIIGLDFDEDGIPDSQLAANHQKNLSAQYRSSWAVSAGAAYKFREIDIHFSAEWYNAVNVYEVIKAEDFQAQTTGETISNSVQDALKSIINLGIGMEFVLDEHMGLFTSFITDFTAFSPDSDISASSWNIYHLTVGSTAHVMGLELTLGVEYAFGSSTKTQLIDLTGASASNYLLGNPQDTVIEFRRFEFILGFSFIM